MKNSILIVLFLFVYKGIAQEYFPKHNGVKTQNTNYTAFFNGKIFITPTKVIGKSGILLIRNGRVIAVGDKIKIPKNSIIVNLNGKHIYPSFIDAYSTFGVKQPKQKKGAGKAPQYDAERYGFYWNDHIRPDQRAINYFEFNETKSEALRKAGFGVVNTHIKDGIIRGTGALIALTPNGFKAPRILDKFSAQYYGLKKSKTSRQAYPTSLMGALALIKQVNYDAQWYEKGNIEQQDRALEAFIVNKPEVQIFDAGNKLNALRADKLGDMLNTQYVIVGGGDEYQRISDIKNTNAKFIIPVNFPSAYNVNNPFVTRSLALRDMREWQQRPANLKILADNGVPFAITTKGLKSPKELLPNVRKAISYGLSKTKALEALTITPAQILSQSHIIGSLKPNTYANFLITSGDIFDKETTIHENWVMGQKDILESFSRSDIRGKYSFALDNNVYYLDIEGKVNKLKSRVITNKKKMYSKMTYDDHWFNLTFQTPDTTKKEYIRVACNVTDNLALSGKAFLPNGIETIFLAKKLKKGVDYKYAPSKKKKKTPPPPIKKPFPVTYPNMAYGHIKLPKQKTLLIKNATVWTNEKEGVLRNTDVLIRNGKISKIGTGLTDQFAEIIDGQWKHLTAGIIDEHSHIATSSVNESGHNSAAEVSIEDVINPEDISIYRNLAGGVTTAQILHGSANPIGGQSAIIKLKWGESANQLIYKNSPKFIKFALGENVKQSNSGDLAKVRFPQTRMGVEQLYIDYFQRAKRYDSLKKLGEPYRKDIELETLAEILNKERFITCHSYKQSEINMLMKVAEKFNFKINTFTHILEGYKIADKLAKHGAGSSTFSDWWAFKYEVNDAIPYNAAILNNAGVLTAINSDDAEMARRLNQEAAKTIKYGNLSEEEALKLITLNPAKLLHIDDRVGSIKEGKDADVVLWSDNPLSIYSKPEKTIIEGRVFFDIDEDKKMRNRIQQERNALITLLLKEKNAGKNTQLIKKNTQKTLHCDSEDYSTLNND